MRDKEAAAEPAPRAPLRAGSVVLGVVAGVLVGVVCALLVAAPRGARFEARLAWGEGPPTTADWPRPARAGESARLESTPRGRELVVTATSAAAARDLTRALAGRHTPSAAQLSTRLAQVREAWQRDAPAGEAGRRTRSTQCAALLLARSRWGEELAMELPLPPPTRVLPATPPPPEVEDAWLNVSWVADDRDPTLLLQALEEAARHERNWFSDAAAWTGWKPSGRAEAWRRWQHSRARFLEPIASQLMAWEGGAQRQALQSTAARALLTVDERMGDPWGPFATATPPVVKPRVRPIASAWLPPLLVGAGAGALLSLLLLVVFAFLRPGPARVPSVAALHEGADPAAAVPELHVVTGAAPGPIVRGALELAAHRVAHGDRVLVVDASPRLQLHERLGRDARWGLLEALAAEMPVMGLVQYGGHPGLYVLPYGNAERAVGWSRLGQKLDELLPQFARVVLAVDAGAPTAIGDSLRGRAMEGWWAGPIGRSARKAEEATGRLGIALHPLSLDGISEVTLEAVSARVAVLRPAGPAPEPAPITAPVVVAPPTSPPPPLEPVVLDCDLQVKQRLRFLAWMRRVQAEDRRTGARVSS